jgi:ABC-type multidrug transport system fused ATPase/permease subunit
MQNAATDVHARTYADHQFFHRVVSLVGQEPVLFSRSVRDNITYGLPDAHAVDVEKVCRLASAHDFIMAMENGCVQLCSCRAIAMCM